MKSCARVPVDTGWFAGFCKRWKIAELSLFGSALRDDFAPESDFDVLVEFETYTGIGFFELSRIEDELEAHFGRRIDLVIKSALRPKLRDQILASREVVFGASLRCIKRAEDTVVEVEREPEVPDNLRDLVEAVVFPRPPEYF